MPVDIGTIKAHVGVETADFDSGMKRVQSTMGGFASHMASTMGGLASAPLRAASSAMGGLASAATAPTRALGALGSELGKIGQIAAGVALGGVMNQLGMGLSERLSGSIDAVRDLGAATVTLQRQIGGSTEEASGLLAVFGRYGMSQEDASRSLGTFSKHLLGLEDMTDAAIIGGKGFAGTMKDLGVNFLDVAGNALPMDDLLGKVADRFNQMPDGVDKTATAMTLFGKSGKDMLPILNLGRQGMQDAMDTAKKYGLVLSQDNVNDIKKFGAAQKDMNQAFSGLMIQVGTMVMPTLAKLATSVAGLVQQFSLKFLPAIREAANFLGSTFGPAFSAAGELIGKFVDYFGPSNTFDLMGKLFGPDIGPKIDQVVRKFESVGTAIMGIVTGSTGLGTLGIILGDALGSMGELGGSILGKVGEAIGGIDWSGLKDKAGDIAGGIGKWLGGALGTLGELSTTIKDKLQAALGDAADKIDWMAAGKAAGQTVGDFFTGIGSLAGEIQKWASGLDFSKVSFGGLSERATMMMPGGESIVMPSFEDKIKEFMTSFGAAFSAAAPKEVKDFFETVGKGIDSVKLAAQDATPYVQNFWAELSKIPFNAPAKAPAIDLSIMAAAPLAPTIDLSIMSPQQRDYTTLKENWEAYWKQVELSAQMPEGLKNTIDARNRIMAGAMTPPPPPAPTGGWDMSKVWDDLERGISKAGDKMGEKGELIGALFGTIGGAVHSFAGVLVSLGQTVSDVNTGITTSVVGMGNTWQSTWNDVVVGGVKNVAEEISKALSPLQQTLTDVGTWCLEAGGPLGLLAGYFDSLASSVGIAIGMLDKISGKHVAAPVVDSRGERPEPSGGGWFPEPINPNEPANMVSRMVSGPSSAVAAAASGTSFANAPVMESAALGETEGFPALLSVTREIRDMIKSNLGRLVSGATGTGSALSQSVAQMPSAVAEAVKKAALNPTAVAPGVMADMMSVLKAGDAKARGETTGTLADMMSQFAVSTVNKVAALPADITADMVSHIVSTGNEIASLSGTVADAMSKYVASTASKASEAKARGDSGLQPVNITLNLDGKSLLLPLFGDPVVVAEILRALSRGAAFQGARS
jgi:hypothetical protein